MMIKMFIPLVLLGLGMASSTTGQVSNSTGNSTDYTKAIWKGIEALDDLTTALAKDEVVDVLAMFNTKITPCLHGWETFFSRAMRFVDVPNSEMSQIKAAYSKLSENLSKIEIKTTEMKHAIDWNAVKFDLVSMETRIRRIGEKLEDVMRKGVDKADGKKDYIRVYEDIYKSSGLGLFDSIVSNYGSYQENILQAGLKYGTGQVFDDYLKGLIAFLLRASSDEIAYEKFKGQHRKMVTIWNQRMLSVKMKMDQAIYDKRDKLLNDLPTDLRSISSRTSSHQSFVNEAYKFLMEKYWWRYWFVMSYKYGTSSPNYVYFKALAGSPMFTAIDSSYRRRNYMVCSTEKRAIFNATSFHADIKDRECPSTSSCSYPAQYLNTMHPEHGVAKFVVSPENFNYAIRATAGRHVSGHVTFKNGATYYPLVMFYFG